MISLTRHSSHVPRRILLRSGSCFPSQQFCTARQDRLVPVCSNQSVLSSRLCAVPLLSHSEALRRMTMFSVGLVQGVRGCGLLHSYWSKRSTSPEQWYAVLLLVELLLIKCNYSVAAELGGLQWQPSCQSCRAAII